VPLSWPSLAFGSLWLSRVSRIKLPLGPVEVPITVAPLELTREASYLGHAPARLKVFEAVPEGKAALALILAEPGLGREQPQQPLESRRSRAATAS